MLVYSPSIPARLHYVCGFIGKELTGKPFELTDNKKIFLDAPGAKINYSPDRIGDNEYWLRPHSLLFETGIREQVLLVFELNGNKAFFGTEGDLSFDIFAAIFYLLSRYEEYGPQQKDVYGRYDHKNSLAFRENFLDKPLINSWIQAFKQELIKKFPSFTTHNSPFTFIPTYDIDEAYAYKYKSWIRRAGAAARDLLNRNWKDFSLRKKVLANQVPDPFDSYDWLDNLHDRSGLQPRYFFLAAHKTGKYDKNILPRETAWQALARKHASKYNIGIHPSWQSGDDPSLLQKEIATFEKTTGKTILSSRQHFIRFRLPITFRQLIAAGIMEDFSMGYGSINGFRASVASPFYWYDLESESTTNLLLYPFCFMDANSFFEQKFTPQQALEEMRRYYVDVKKVNGTFISIWHNTFLGTANLFSGWREIYEQFVEEVT
ncbi:MAG: polysaccharide deacetylase family protein [Chitinophagaceae bacterium]